MFQDDDVLPPHQREGWAERMYEQAERQRKAAKEEKLLEQIALEWAIETGAKP